MVNTQSQARSKRWMLILLVCVGQFACLTIGAMWFANRLSDNLALLMRHEIIANNAHMANQLARSITELDLKDFTPQSQDWLRLQDIIENTNLPNSGYFTVIDSTNGKVLSHPRWNADERMSEMNLGQTKLYGPAGGRSILDSVVSGDYVSMGWARIGGDELLLAVRKMPGLGIMILAQQREAPLVAAISQIVISIKSAGLAVAVALVAVSLFFTAGIVERYESRMSAVHGQIDNLADQKSDKLLATRHAVIVELAKLVESRDSSAGEHLDRVRAYTEILGRELSDKIPSLTEETISVMGLTSCLHDIGNVSVPESIFQNAGKLTDEQRVTMQKHTTLGGERLQAIKQKDGQDQFIDVACEIAFAHHERWDGSGYPNGLIEENIPLSARIVALADVYDALTTKRVYNQPATHAEARQIILVGKKRQFDPAVVDAFLATEDQFNSISADAQFDRLKQAQPQLASSLT